MHTRYVAATGEFRKSNTLAKLRELTRRNVAFFESICDDVPPDVGGVLTDMLAFSARREIPSHDIGNGEDATQCARGSLHV